jgi:LPXTG-motif cell wall-anchored protein
VNRARFFAALGAFALAGAAVIVPAMAASAAPEDTCSGGGGTEVTFDTATALWHYVCENSGELGEASTTNKSDAIDGIGYLYLNYGTADQVEIGAPAGNTAVNITPGVGGDIQFLDLSVPYAVGDLVNVEVQRAWGGTTMQWVITVTDADTGDPRPDVAVTFIGNLGSDSATIYTISPNAFVSYGDIQDPINMFRIDSANYVPALASQNIVFSVTSPATITYGMVDYDCTNYDDAVDLAEASVATLASHFGESFQAAGTDPCMAVANPVHLTTGQAFDIPLSYTFRPGGFDFTAGGSSFLWEYPDFLTYTATDSGVPGTAPGLRISGTAPSEPGEYWIIPAVQQDAEGDAPAEAHYMKVIVEAPTLPATGVDGTPLLLSAAALGVLGVAFVAGARRRARATT